MTKRHQFSVDLPTKIRRIQELIMSHSGIDEFYEIIRVVLAKSFSELEGHSELPDIKCCNDILRRHTKEISFILDDIVELQTPPGIFPEVRRVLGSTSIRMQDFNALDQVFEQLTSRSYKADKGQYFTPRQVVDMCVEAINPKPDETVCDPACGSAAFLKSTHDHGLQHYNMSSSLYGFDYSHRACQVAKVVSLMGANGSINIHQLDSLRLPSRSLLDRDQLTIEGVMGPTFKGFDIIMTNPPFAGDISGEMYATDYDLAALYSKRLERDIIFIERCIRLLRIGGRFAIVVPDNKISGRLFSELRHWIGKQSRINAVVSLHRYTFLPYTSQKAAVLFATKMPPSLSTYDSNVCFIRSDRPGKTSNGSAVYKAGSDANLPAYHSLNHDLQDVAARVRSALCDI